MVAAVSLFAILFSLLAYRRGKLSEHRTAFTELQRLGASLLMTTPDSLNIDSMEDSIGGWRHRLLADPAVYVPVVGLQNPNLTDDDVRAMIPHLSALIPLHGQNVAGESFIVLDINNSPVMTPALCKELKPLLPGFQFMGDPVSKPGPTAYHPGY